MGPENGLIYQRLNHELEIMKDLDHPHILKIIECYDQGKRLEMVMELCEGGELFDYLQRYEYCPERIASLIVQQILSGVTYCHGKNIVHRDLRLENIMLEDKLKGDDVPCVKISDFGASATYRPLKGSREQKKPPRGHQYMTEFVGSLYTVAPEVINQQVYDEKVDLWSIGVIMYMLLTGEPPFGGSNESEILKNIQTGFYNLEHPRIMRCTNEARDLLSKLLEFEPRKRISAE